MQLIFIALMDGLSCIENRLLVEYDKYKKKACINSHSIRIGAGQKTNE
jgi:hypothetical protein